MTPQQHIGISLVSSRASNGIGTVTNNSAVVSDGGGVVVTIEWGHFG